MPPQYNSFLWSPYRYILYNVSIVYDDIMLKINTRYKINVYPGQCLKIPGTADTGLAEGRDKNESKHWSGVR